MSTPADAYETAWAHHQAGRLAEAAALYQQVLRAQPQHADALHKLGLVLLQSQQPQQAASYLSRAILLRGNDATWHAHLGQAYRALGKLVEATKCYQQAARLDPGSSSARNILGTLYQQQGQLEPAIAAYTEALRLRPDSAAAHNNLGLALRERGDVQGAISLFESALRADPRMLPTYENLAATLAGANRSLDAIACHRRAVETMPDNPQAHFNLGVALETSSDLAGAADCYRDTLRIAPNHALAHNNLGAVLRALGQPEEALECFRRAVAADPHLSGAYFNMGLVHNEQGRARQALEAYAEALRVEPDYVDALLNYGDLLEANRRWDEALACFNRVVQLRPELPSGFFGRANIYRAMRQFSQAVTDYEHALRLKPDCAIVHNNLSIIYNRLGRPDAAERCCRKGLELAPDLAPLWSNLGGALSMLGRQDEALEVRRQALRLRPDAAPEHSNLIYDLHFLYGADAEGNFQEHLNWARLHAEPLTRQAAQHENLPDPERRVRIGYLSAFFRRHAVNYFTEPILTSHDHQRFEIICYSDVTRDDAATARIKAAVDGWRAICGWSDQEVERQVREDGIDILVDLTGHIGTNRMLLFARKPAPVQVTYIGYQNTTGMTAMDYRLTDERADPPGVTDRYYTEKLVRLPRSFFCYRPGDNAPPVSPLPALERGHVTFGSFNKFAKVTAATLDAWMRILQRVPGARLLVLASRGGQVESRLHALAASRSIDPSRVELFDRCEHTAYMRLLSQADIGLDPFPFNGHTTTCDCVWMGVPVVMLQGQTYVTRFGSSVLANVGLESWIATSVDEYVGIAVRAAQDVGALARLRSELRGQMAASPLLDFAGFTRNLEAAYRQMWRAWCAERR